MLATSLGCLLIPLPEQGLSAGRGHIPPEDQHSLRLGESTREEVLLRFGEPDLCLDEGAVFIYRWERIAGILIIAGGYSAAGADIHRTNLFLLAFDTEGRLTRTDHQKGVFLNTNRRAAAWASPKGKPQGEPTPGIPKVLVLAPGLAAPKPLPSPLTFMTLRLEPLKDSRLDGPSPAHLGEFRRGPLSSGAIRAQQSAASLVQSALEAELRAEGADLQSQVPGLLLTGELLELKVGAAWDPSNRGAISVPLNYWMQIVSAEVRVRLRVQPASRPEEALILELQATDALALHPATILNTQDFEAVLSRCLQDLQAQLRSHPQFRKVLASP